MDKPEIMIGTHKKWSAFVLALHESNPKTETSVTITEYKSGQTSVDVDKPDRRGATAPEAAELLDCSSETMRRFLKQLEEDDILKKLETDEWSHEYIIAPNADAQYIMDYLEMY